MKNKLKVAVIVGYHSFEFPAFQDFFESIEEIHPYIQHLEQFTSSSKAIRESYDALLFYTMCNATPVNDGPWYEGKALDALSELGDTSQGLIVLHHSLMAFPDWPVWESICGVDPKSFTDYALDQDLRFVINDREHYITRGMEDFSMTDEAYLMGPSRDSRPLVCSASPNNMPHVAWVRQYRASRVFCYQSGHGPSSWNRREFREILRRGFLWTTGRELEA